MINEAESDAKHNLLLDVISSRKALKEMFRNFHIQQQIQARQTEGYFQPLVDKLKEPEYETPSNEEIRSFLKRHSIVFDFLSPKAELSFTKDPQTDNIRVHLGKNPKTWKEVTFNDHDGTMKIEGKEKVFDIDNHTTFRLLEGRDPKKLGLTPTDVKIKTKDYIDMWDDRSTVITNVKNIKQAIASPSVLDDPYMDDDFDKHTLIGDDDDPNISTVTKVARGPATPEQEKKLSKTVELASYYHNEAANALWELQHANFLPPASLPFTQGILRLTAESDLLALRKAFEHTPRSTRSYPLEKLMQLQRSIVNIINARSGYEQKSIEIDKMLEPENFNRRLTEGKIDIGSDPEDRRLIGLQFRYGVDKDVLHRALEEEKGAVGRGIIVIPEDKDELLSRLRILVAAKNAGHSAVEDEKNAILQRLLEKGIVTEKDYKKLGKIKLSHKK